MNNSVKKWGIVGILFLVLIGFTIVLFQDYGEENSQRSIPMLPTPIDENEVDNEDVENDSDSQLSLFVLEGEWENDTSNQEISSPLYFNLMLKDGEFTATGSYLYNNASRIEGITDPDEETVIFRSIDIERSNGQIIITGEIESTYAGTSGMLTLTFKEDTPNELIWEIEEDEYPEGGIWPLREVLYDDFENENESVQEIEDDRLTQSTLHAYVVYNKPLSNSNDEFIQPPDSILSSTNDAYLVKVDLGIPYSDNDFENVENALEYLINRSETSYGESGFLNFLANWNADIEVTENSDGKTLLNISGEVIGIGSLGDIKMLEQLTETINLYIDDVEITINGSEKNYRCFTDMSGLCE